jgi:hypothetical protein
MIPIHGFYPVSRSLVPNSTSEDDDAANRWRTGDGELIMVFLLPKNDPRMLGRTANSLPGKLCKIGNPRQLTGSLANPGLKRADSRANRAKQSSLAVL